MTTLGIVSDIHTEFWTEKEFETIGPMLRNNTKDADIILLAGDIGVGAKSILAANTLFPDKEICIVAGNHEFYKSTHDEVIDEMIKTANNFPRIHFLNRDTFVFNDIRIIGATLWTDFNFFGTQINSMIAVSTRTYYKNGFRTPYPDFWWIYNKKDCITSQEMLGWHMRDKEWLMQEIDKPFDGFTVVMTHHSPVGFSLQEEYMNHPTSVCYASRLENKLLDKKIDVVVWGHTHYSYDRTILNTRFVSNQVGYLGKELQKNVFTETGCFGTCAVL